MSRYCSTRSERAAYRAKMERLYEINKGIVAAGKCPDCGAGLRRNLSIAGWWQCQQFGAVGFRKDAAKSSCDFQIFTE